jgi:hypothetical protein
MSDARDSDGGPSYCHNCGSELDAGDRFCSDCGTEVGSSGESADTESASESGPSASAEADTQRAFRRRVNTHLANGWEVQYDAGDEVVLVDRGFGSIGIHVLLLIFTSGIGNVIYGWYNYSKDADRMTISTDDGVTHMGDSEAPNLDGSDDSGEASLRHYALGLVLLLLGVFVIGTSLTSFGGILLGIGLVLLSIVVLPPARRRVRNRHPPTTFGTTNTVEERTAPGTDQLCSICREPIDQGVVREYEKEKVVAGIPLYTEEAGENWYCESCHLDHRGAGIGEERFRDLDVDESDLEVDESDLETATESDSNR